MSGVESWSTTAASNNAAVPNGAPEGWAPSGVNGWARQTMASVRAQLEHAEWFNWGDTCTYASGTSFTISGDVTARYTVGRRIWVNGATPGDIYGYISASSYSAPNTTVTVVFDSGSMSNETLTVYLSIIDPTNSSIRKLDVVDINGGAIDGTAIGGATPAAGAFTTGSFSGDVTFGGLATPSKYGALVYGATNALAHNTATILTFPSEDYDTNSIHSTVSNTSRLTVPTGVTLVRIRGVLSIAGVAASIAVAAAVKKNGSTSYNGFTFTGCDGNSVAIFPYYSTTIGTALPVESPILQVVAGDYFELEGYQRNSPAVSINTHASTWFAMEIIG